MDDPDTIAMPRMPTAIVTLPIATDVVVAKKRVYVAGVTELLGFDNAMEIASSSKPKVFDKTNFIGSAPILNVTSLHYEPSLDILTTADDGIPAMQTFKQASTMAMPSMAIARIGTDADDLLHPAMTPGGQLFGTRNGQFTTLYYDGAHTAAGSVVLTKFVFGQSRPKVANNRIWISGTDGGIGGAAVWVYPSPVQNTMMPPDFELTFGGPNATTSAREVAVSPGYLATAVWKNNSNDSFVCIMTNPSTLNAQSTCNNPIMVAGKILRIAERKGSLYVLATNPNGTSSRLEIYRQPMADMKPTVTMDLPNVYGTGIAFADP